MEHKTNYFSSLVHSASAIVFISLLVEQYHDTATSGTYNSDLRNCDDSCSVCVGKHVTVSRYCRFCARLGDGTSTVGSGARQWERVLSANTGVHILTMETRSSLWQATIVAEEPVGRMAF